MRDTTHVTTRNRRGAIQVRMTLPEKRPMVSAVKNRPVPSSPSRVMSMSKRSFSSSGMPALTLTSAPT